MIRHVWYAVLNRFHKGGWPAWAVLGMYAVLALSAQLGTNVAGQGLDPVWAAAQQRGRLRVAVDFGYAPFTGTRQVMMGGQASEQPYGYDVDLAREVARQLGMDVEFVPTTLEAAYETIDTGKADAVISALPYAPEQGWRAAFSTFYFNAGQVLVVRDSSPLQDAERLGGLTIAVALGSDADTLVRSRAAQDASIHVRAAYDTPEQAFAALRAGDADAVVADNASALTAINSQAGLRLVPPALTLEPYAVAVAPRAYLLRDAINGALERLRTNGWLEQNGAKWFQAGAGVAP
ncbi:amino acid ABC transporter substrate-binding protein [Chloroflexia bacterium SDU3-3]|nr:amino acid ABC transporter substrate-binding protein [Chloroflexia bacterium SDU3-3]